MAFQLDTSGYVYDDGTRATGTWKAYAWSDLSPFAQGYIEAMFEDHRHGALLKPGRAGVPCGFSDLAPETLARIVEDCEAYSAPFRPTAHPLGGSRFWQDRQAGFLGRFPKLSPYLADDGLVYLREAGQ